MIYCIPIQKKNRNTPNKYISCKRINHHKTPLDPHSSGYIGPWLLRRDVFFSIKSALRDRIDRRPTLRSGHRAEALGCGCTWRFQGPAKSVATLLQCCELNGFTKNHIKSPHFARTSAQKWHPGHALVPCPNSVWSRRSPPKYLAVSLLCSVGCNLGYIVYGCLWVQISLRDIHIKNRQQPLTKIIKKHQNSANKHTYKQKSNKHQTVYSII